MGEREAIEEQLKALKKRAPWRAYGWIGIGFGVIFVIARAAQTDTLNPSVYLVGGVFVALGLLLLVPAEIARNKIPVLEANLKPTGIGPSTSFCANCGAPASGPYCGKCGSKIGA